MDINKSQVLGLIGALVLVPLIVFLVATGNGLIALIILAALFIHKHIKFKKRYKD